MNKFGVCNYDFNACDPKVENLERFDTYKEAFDCYLKRMTEYEDYPYNIGYTDDLWIVWITEDNKIVQFEQTSLNAKCKIIDINGDILNGLRKTKNDCKKH